MGTKAHSLVSVAARHPIVHLSYPDAADRAAGTNETSGITAGVNNVHDVALQIDTGTYWILDSVGPLVWSQLLTGTVTALNPTSVLIVNATGDVSDDGANFTYAASVLTLNGSMELAGGVQIGSDEMVNAASAVSYGAFMARNSAQTSQGPFWLTGVLSNSFVLAQEADKGYDFAHGIPTAPTLFIHSATQSATEWMGLYHNTTDGIISTGAGALQLLAATLVQIGNAGATSHALGADDLFVSGELEVDGRTYPDGGMTFSGTGLTLNHNIPLYIGTSNESTLRYSSTQTPDSLFWGLPVLSNAIIFGQQGDFTYDWAHALQTNPTVFIQSANQTATEWLSFAHNQTDGVITTGAGALQLMAATLVQIGDAGATSHALGADDLFVSGMLEVDSDVFFDGAVKYYSYGLFADSVELRLGNTGDSRIDWSSIQTKPSVVWGLGDTSKALILCDQTDRNTDWGAPDYVDPTVRIQSAAVTPTLYVARQHNQVDAKDIIGTGGKVTEHVLPIDMADDGTFNLPTSSAGFGFLIVGDSEEYAHFVWDSAGNVDLVAQSANIATTDSDTDFCIITGADPVVIKNRLGAAKKVVFDYHYTTP